MRARPVAVLAAAGLAITTGLAGLAGPPAASADTGAAHSTHTGSHTIGGPLLAGKGVIVSPLPGAPALPPPSQLPASSWMVTDLTTGQVLAAKDPHGKYLPASTLKTLTAVTLLPKLDPLSTFRATVTDEDVDGSRVGLVAGMSYTVAKLFTCMLVVSANDAADALAQDNGGIRTTVLQMNAEARKLQAYDTFARTPSGLDGPGETTSAYDLALIAQAGLAMPAFRHYVSVVHSTVPAPHHKHFAIYTHNELLTTYRGDIGVKNGYTVDAQGTDVNAATRHGHTIVVTLMHAYPDFWPMATDLLNWGFKAIGKVTPIGTLVSPITPIKRAAQIVVHPATVSNAVTAPHHGRSWPLTEIGVAAVLAILIASFLGRRRQIRQRRRYRTRLRLPPL